MVQKYGATQERFVGTSGCCTLRISVYKIIYSAVDGNPEARFKCFKRLVGERGFEPPTPWSRTRSRGFLKSLGFACFQVIAVE